MLKMESMSITKRIFFIGTGTVFGLLIAAALVFPTFIKSFTSLHAADPSGYILKDFKCMSCHNYHRTEDEKYPSFDDIAKMHEYSNMAAISALALKLREGGNGQWMSESCSPTRLHRNESMYIINWILNRKYDKGE